MTVEKISKRLVEIVADRLDVKPEEVTNEASFVEDLGADSLDIVDLAMAVEDAFGVQIKDEDYIHMTRLCDAAAFLQRSLEAPAPEPAVADAATHAEQLTP